jgi:hypothetical protein
MKSGRIYSNLILLNAIMKQTCLQFGLMYEDLHLKKGYSKRTLEKVREQVEAIGYKVEVNERTYHFLLKHCSIKINVRN